jgi:hypothetical protein
MRFALFSAIIALFAAVAMAVAPKLYSVIISFPKNTPDHVVESAKDMVRANKGKITHEYSKFPPLSLARGWQRELTSALVDIIQGFAADIAEAAIVSIQSMNAEYPALVEGDGIMTTQEDNKKGKVGTHF